MVDMIDEPIEGRVPRIDRQRQEHDPKYPITLGQCFELVIREVTVHVVDFAAGGV